MTEILDIFKVIGWPGVGLLIGWRVCAFLAVKLFSDELDKDGRKKGLALKFADALIEFIEGVRQTNEKLAVTQQDIHQEIAGLRLAVQHQGLIAQQPLDEPGRAPGTRTVLGGPAGVGNIG